MDFSFENQVIQQNNDAGQAQSRTKTFVMFEQRLSAVQGHHKKRQVCRIVFLLFAMLHIVAEDGCKIQC